MKRKFDWLIGRVRGERVEEDKDEDWEFPSFF